MTQTKALRVMIVLLAVVVIVGMLVVASFGADTALMEPSLGGWATAAVIAVGVGTLPVFAGLVITWRLLGVIDRGGAFADAAIVELRRLRWLIAGTAVYFALGLAVLWSGTGLMHLGLLIPWLAAQVVGLFLFFLVALLERLFTAGIEYRTDSELTV